MHWSDEIGTVRAKKKAKAIKPGVATAAAAVPDPDIEDNTTGKIVGWAMGGLLVLIVLKGIKEALK